MNNDLIILIDKYQSGEATESEREAVDSWYLSFESRPGLVEQMSPDEAMKAMKESFAAISRKLHF